MFVHERKLVEEKILEFCTQKDFQLLKYYGIGFPSADIGEFQPHYLQLLRQKPARKN